MAQCTCRVSPPQQTRLHTNTRMHICCPAPPDTLLFVCVVNVGHKCVCVCVYCTVCGHDGHTVSMGVSRQNYKYKYTHTHALNPAVGHFNISFG